MRNSKNKIWIGLEGIGGCGKTTQFELLKANLPKDLPSLFFSFESEFSKRPVGKLLSSLLKQESDNFRIVNNKEISNTLIHLLVISDQLESIRNIFLDSKLDIVIFDRFVLSNIAHALSEISNSIESKKYFLIQNALLRIFDIPELKNENIIVYNIFFDCSIEVAKSRINNRNKIEINSDQKVFLNNLNNAYKSLIKHQDNVVVIDSNVATNELFINVKNEITNIITENFK